MQTLHPADRVTRPDQVEVPAELEAEIRGIAAGRPRNRGLWWAVAALVVAIVAAVLWPAATVADIHDSWKNVPVGLMPAGSEIHDSWMSAPVERMPTLTRITSPIPARFGSRSTTRGQRLRLGSRRSASRSTTRG